MRWPLEASIDMGWEIEQIQVLTAAIWCISPCIGAAWCNDQAAFAPDDDNYNNVTGRNDDCRNNEEDSSQKCDVKLKVDNRR